MNQELSSSGESLGVIKNVRLNKDEMINKKIIYEKFPQVDHDCQTSVIEEGTVIKEDCRSHSFSDLSKESLINININAVNTINNIKPIKIKKFEKSLTQSVQLQSPKAAREEVKNEVEKVRSFRLIAKAKETPKLVNRSTETNNAAVHPLEYEGYKISKTQEEEAKIKELKQNLNEIKEEIKKIRYDEKLYNRFMEKTLELSKKWDTKIHKYGWGEDDVQQKLYQQYETLYCDALNENINQDIRMQDIMQAYFTYLNIVTYVRHPTITMQQSNEGATYIQNVKNYIKKRMKNDYNMEDIFLRATEQFPDIIHYMKIHKMTREDIFKELGKDVNSNKNNKRANKKDREDKQFFTFTEPRYKNNYGYQYKTFKNNNSYDYQ